ncbi:hypothetical protein ACFPL7_11585 [Dongia soli]|uniref:Uncharacterized protein n=1 Tax=Dongia soli TaxID=600628 RepID=A0ABU5EC58_9PROT|nr:hypothetical protein [Dongia soli]MDY0883590.1 hypothetical protein [Dongia soli]
MFDIKNLSRLKKLDESGPDSIKAFWVFDNAVFSEGALSVQQKKIIAVAVASRQALHGFRFRRFKVLGLFWSGSHFGAETQ